MSLLDVIKYPISDNPALPELESLPKKVISKTYKRLGIVGTSTNVEKCFQLYWIFCNEPNAKDLAKTIRKVLEELP